MVSSGTPQLLNHLVADGNFMPRCASISCSSTSPPGLLFAPMRPETVYAKVDSLTRNSAGVGRTGWSPHWLRHTHATALVLSGRRRTW